MLFSRRDKADFRQQLRDWVWPRRGWRRAGAYIWHRIARISESPHRIALGIASGVFVSFTPFLGFHILLAALIALIIKGHVLASAFGTLIGNPVTFPMIWIGSYNLGIKLLGRVPSETVTVTWPPDVSGPMLESSARTWHDLWHVVEPVLLPMTVGGCLLGLAFATLSYYITRVGVAAYQSRRRELRFRRRVALRHPELADGGDIDDRRL
ncbi:DUF2062 domain-containing protein [Rhodoligotrophos ferricapiens]|uniref:DUF2062 domain-containing protein n=1 Tax=Rhodoligotrophos ferricapiens TaxID=3069264 RepID=UPI00315D3A5C